MAAAASGNPPDPRPATAYERSELRRRLTDLGAPPYRADQVIRGLYGHGATSWTEIRGLPPALVERLEATLPLLGSTTAQVVTAPDGTTKLGVRLPDGQLVEAVLIPSPKRVTLCLSTQAGCPVGCTFCASGLGGLQRNLTTWEIVEQLCHAARHTDRRIDHLVVMGVGEPLYNLDALLPALDRIQAPETFHLGARRITVSTAGVIPGIMRLAERRPPIQLAISLHAADQDLRESLVPLARTYPVPDLVAAAQTYQENTGRQVTLEIVLLQGVNDTPTAARTLADLAAGRGFHVNLIPYNPVAEMPYRRPDQDRVDAFAAILARAGISQTVRLSRGGDEAAACGQLRSRAADPKEG